MTISWNVQERSQYGDENANEMQGQTSSETFFYLSSGNLFTHTSTWHHEDIIWGNGDADTLVGRAEDDTLYGGTGNDLLYGGDESTSPDSDDGYTFRTGQFTTVSRDAGKDLLAGGNGHDTLYGGAGSDSLYGENGMDLMYGGDGTDLMNGGNSDDIMLGQDGNDTLYGQDGADLLYSGELGNGASDVLVGGNNADTFFLGEAADTTGGGLNVDWANLGLSMAGDVTDLAFTAFAPQFKIAKEIVPMIFDGIKGILNGQTSTLDRPNSNASATIADFNFREDVVIIPVNQDVYISDDTNGDNTLSFKYNSSDSTQIFADLELEDAGTVFGDGSTTYDNNAEDAIQRSLIDSAIYIDSNGATLGSEGGTALNIDSSDLENLGSNKFLVVGAYSGWNLQGGNAPDYLYGTNHDDVIAGYQLDNLGGTSFAPEIAENDELRGFNGNDIFYGGAGNNYIYGGNDSDTSSYIHSTNAISVDLSSTTNDSNGTYASASNGFGGTDKLYNIENIVGSDNADNIEGDNNDNILSTGRGNYSVDENGNDVQLNTPLETMGSDTLTGNGGDDTFVLSGGNHTITDYTVDFVNNEVDKIQVDIKEYFEPSGNQEISLDYTLSGGDLTLEFSGEQVATLNNISSSDVVTILKNIDLIGKEDFTGANRVVDVLIGTESDDSLKAFGYDDYVSGGAGNDTLTGNGGEDVMFGGEGTDRLEGMNQDDILIGGYGNDTFVFNKSTSTAGIDRILDFSDDEGDVIEIDKSVYGISSVNDVSFDFSTNELSVDGSVIAVLENQSNFNVFSSLSLV
ncbi:calcium-binding protein [Dapis sp. BLCC M229]|uniref:calcium-binding protein n=1 Tax=Dapis sp. BLCC M229 TaxID=3400188 RepID=UPI003CF6E408